MSAQVTALRELLESRYPSATPITRRTAGALSTGIRELNGALPGGGLPRGRITTWAPGGGATAMLRAGCREVVRGGERAAWIDGAGLVSVGSWKSDGVLFRPEGEREALECAEELMRSGGFALVVLTGASGGEAERVRISRAVREGGGALVMLERSGFMATVRIASRMEVAGFRWRMDPFGRPAEVESVEVRARVRAPGWSKETAFTLAVTSYDVRMSMERGMGDRRGAAG